MNSKHIQLSQLLWSLLDSIHTYILYLQLPKGAFQLQKE